MVPPPALRKRLQATGAGAAAEGGGVKRKEAGSSRVRLALLAALAGCASLLAWAWHGGAEEGSSTEEALTPEAARLLEAADVAIRRSYNYTLALEHLQGAYALAPESVGVRQFYASVLLSLGKVEDAWSHFDAVFSSGSAVAKDPHVLQQYVLTMHRLGKHAALDEVWPKIAATPGVKWRSPLQCPDHVDEALLGKAEPFPSPRGIHVTDLMAQHKDSLLAEFEAFAQRPDWASKSYFRANQDNDLVDGNDEQRWTEMLLFDKGSWNPQNCQIFAKACKLFRGLREVEGILHGKRSGQVSLLKLEAGSTLVPHFGSVNWRYTAHLGLLVPDGVVMRAGNETRPYAPKEVLLVDDSFLHSVEHRGSGPRVTLFINFFRPETSPLTYDEWLDQKHR